MACLTAGVGCGARTETLFDENASFGGYGAGGRAPSATGGSPVSPSGGGFSTTGGYGTGGGFGTVGGFVGVAGGFGTGGSFGTAGGFVGVGGFGTGGSFGTGGFAAGGRAGAGGAVQVGGFSSVAGSPSVGGSPGTGGFGAVGGFVGTAGAGGIVGLCVAAAQSACDRCACKGCASELDACFQDIGCALIFACAQAQRCQGFNCYRDSTCRGVIDQFGGLTGAAVSEVFSLASCSAISRSSCGCN